MGGVLDPFGNRPNIAREAPMTARNDMTQVPDANSGFLFGGLEKAELGTPTKSTTVNWGTIDESNQKFVMGLIASSLKTGLAVFQSVGKDEALQATLISYIKAAVDHIPVVKGYETGYTVLANPVFRAEDGSWAGIPKGAKERAEKVPVGAEIGVSIRVTKKRGRLAESASGESAPKGE